MRGRVVQTDRCASATWGSNPVEVAAEATKQSSSRAWDVDSTCDSLRDGTSATLDGIKPELIVFDGSRVERK